MLEKKSLRESDRLGARRRRSRRRLGILFFILIGALAGSLVWCVKQPSVRISDVHVLESETSLADIARSEMQGDYFGFIPRDSIFFFPERTIRARILAEHSDIAAVSIVRSTPASISIDISKRVPVALWCGLKKTVPAVEEYCYVFDSSGFIYAAADVASTTKPLHSFTVYAPLVGDGEEPLRAVIRDAEKMPSAFDFARELPTLGGTVGSITFRDDEVDVALTSGTRITYVRGEEEKAFAALISTKPNLNLSDGSLEYVDLRFDGKVYVKRK